MNQVKIVSKGKQPFQFRKPEAVPEKKSAPARPLSDPLTDQEVEKYDRDRLARLEAITHVPLDEIRFYIDSEQLHEAAHSSNPEKAYAELFNKGITKHKKFTNKHSVGYSVGRKIAIKDAVKCLLPLIGLPESQEAAGTIYYNIGGFEFSRYSGKCSLTLKMTFQKMRVDFEIDTALKSWDL